MAEQEKDFLSYFYKPFQFLADLDAIPKAVLMIVGFGATMFGLRHNANQNPASQAEPTPAAAVEPAEVVAPNSIEYKGVRPTIKFNREVTGAEIAEAKGLIVKYAQSINYEKLRQLGNIPGLAEFKMTPEEQGKLDKLGVSNLPELKAFIDRYLDTMRAVPINAINAGIVEAPQQKTK